LTAENTNLVIVLQIPRTMSDKVDEGFRTGPRCNSIEVTSLTAAMADNMGGM
jgi:hypothetical protein